MPRPLASALLIAVSLLAPLLPPRAGAELLLNEILYDPAGPDEGMEFVELWNPDTAAVAFCPTPDRGTSLHFWRTDHI